MTALFLDHVWQSTMCAGAIAILTLACRGNRARLRYGLWLAASVKFLVPFAALAVDRTGLTGIYDLTLKWTPEAGLGPPSLLGLPQPPPPPADPDTPNIFTALQEQLGLKLEAGRGPVEVVVIDRLEKPTLD